jgi:hypothetical protein
VGRFADLCGDVAAEADETPGGLVLPEDTLARLYALGWEDDDISDALEFVHASFVQNELLEAADSLSARLVEVLGAFGGDEAFRSALAGRARLPLEVLGQLTRRVAYLEEVLAPLRDGSPVDRVDFDRLVERLAHQEPPTPAPQRRIRPATPAGPAPRRRNAATRSKKSKKKA